MRRSSFCLIPLLCLILFGCATANPAASPTRTVSETLATLAKRHHVCGAALVVIKNRKLDSIEYTTACSPAPRSGANSVFQAASLSKPVFAYAVLKLVAQGKMALDVPVMTYLPQGYRHQFNAMAAQPSAMVSDPQLHAITVRMVLNHTAGLPNWASGPLVFDSPPGTRWEYSGEGYVLLQRAVEAVTGQPLDRFMRSELFKPLGMQHSDYTWNEGMSHTLLPGTKANGAPRATMPSKTPNAAFSLYTTAADYGNFLVKVLNDDDAIKQISASPVHVDQGRGLSWGLGWGIERDNDDAYIWHWGSNPGYRAFVIASMQTGDGFVLLTNGENGLKLAPPLAQKILPGERQLFQSPILGTDVISIVCNTVRLCL